jgi:hypothetical protein
MSDVLVRPANMPEFRTSIDQLRADVISGLAPPNAIVSFDGGVTWVPAWRAAGLPPPPTSSDDATKYFLPVGRSGWAIVSGYLSLLTMLFVLFAAIVLVAIIERPKTESSLVPVIGVFCALGIPAQLATALLGHRAIRNHPKLLGMGRVIFTYVCTGLLAAISLAIVLVYLAAN